MRFLILDMQRALYLGSNSSYTQDVWKRILFLSQVFAQDCAVERSIPLYCLISRKDLKQEDNLRFLTLFQWDITGRKLERVFRRDPVQGRENKHMSPGKEQTIPLALRQHNASKLLPDTYSGKRIVPHFLVNLVDHQHPTSRARYFVFGELETLPDSNLWGRRSPKSRLVNLVLSLHTVFFFWVRASVYW